MIPLYFIQYSADVGEDTVKFAEAVDMIVNTLLAVPLDERLRLGVIHHEALLDGLFVVVGTATLLTTEDETLHQLVLRHVEFNHRSHLVTTLLEHLLQGFGLRDGTWEAVEDHPLVLTAEGIVD